MVQWSLLTYFRHLAQGGETDLIQSIDSDVTNMTTISKCVITIPWKFKYLLTCPVQNNKNNICKNICKNWAFVKHFETLISSLIQNKSVSF